MCLRPDSEFVSEAPAFRRGGAKAKFDIYGFIFKGVDLLPEVKASELLTHIEVEANPRTKKSTKQFVGSNPVYNTTIALRVET